MDPLARRVAGFGTTVFSEFSALAAQHGAMNLGQGFPDFDGPQEVKDAAIRAISEGVNQYAVGAGALKLRQAIARHSERFYGMPVDPETMISVTSGATEALFDAVMGLVNPGDEVILFEPWYDSYAANVEMAGGQVRPVPLRPPDAGHPRWWFDPAELERAFTPKTRLLLLNTPHNPTGKVYSREELEQIAALCLRHRVPVVADEVYEHLVFAPAKHFRIATLPKMAELTLTIGSGGKSFSFTGWKIGWAIAAPGLRAAVQRAHQWVTFASAAPLQLGIAYALQLPDSYFDGFVRMYQRKRDFLSQALTQAGLRVHPCEGTYFLIASLEGTGYRDDQEFCRFLTREVGVAAIPVSGFYSPEHRESGQFARFAFCKSEAVLEESARRIHARLKGR